MPPTWLRDPLEERAGTVDPGEYAMSLFYVRREDEQYERCRREVYERKQ